MQTEEVKEMDVSHVVVSAWNTRQPTAKQVKASGLLESIRSQGQITPGLGRPHPELEGCIELAAGACRRMACAELGIPFKVIVREMSDEEMMDAILTENLQRENPEPEAEAELIGMRLAEGAAPSEIAARYGRSELWVKRRMKLLAIVPEVRKDMMPGKRLSHFTTEMRERIGDLPPDVQKVASNDWRMADNCHSLKYLNELLSRMACSLDGQD